MECEFSTHAKFVVLLFIIYNSISPLFFFFLGGGVSKKNTISILKVDFIFLLLSIYVQICTFSFYKSSVLADVLILTAIRANSA